MMLIDLYIYRQNCFPDFFQRTEYNSSSESEVESPSSSRRLHKEENSLKAKPNLIVFPWEGIAKRNINLSVFLKPEVDIKMSYFQGKKKKKN